MAVISIKDFPDDLHRLIKAEAALMGLPMKELIVSVLREYLERKKGG